MIFLVQYDSNFSNIISFNWRFSSEANIVFNRNFSIKRNKHRHQDFRYQHIAFSSLSPFSICFGEAGLGPSNISFLQLQEAKHFQWTALEKPCRWKRYCLLFSKKKTVVDPIVSSGGGGARWYFSGPTVEDIQLEVELD